MKKTIISACIAAIAGMSVLSSCGDELKPYPWIADDPNSGSEENLGSTDMDALERQMIRGLRFVINYPGKGFSDDRYQIVISLSLLKNGGLKLDI